MQVAPDISIGYYAQDFSNLNEAKTVYETLAEAMKSGTEEKLRSTAAHFLITSDLLRKKIEAQAVMREYE